MHWKILIDDPHLLSAAFPSPHPRQGEPSYSTFLGGLHPECPSHSAST